MSNFKNPFVEKKSIPLPRIRGNAIQRPDHSWGWDMDIFVGEEYVASMSHPAGAPGFLMKETAVNNMKEHAMEAAKLIGKEAYGVNDKDLEELKFFDFTTNTMTNQI